MKKETVAIVSLAALSTFLLVFCVIPEYPFYRRLSKSQATAMLEELRNLFILQYENERAQGIVEFTDLDRTRLDELRKKLIRAGYTYDININGNTGEVTAGMELPHYALGKEQDALITL